MKRTLQAHDTGVEQLTDDFAELLTLAEVGSVLSRVWYNLDFRDEAYFEETGEEDQLCHLNLGHYL